MVEIGQACEVRWREASKLALETRLAALPHADKIQQLWDSADAIPVPQRKAWLASEAYEDHTGDIEAWLHARAGTPFSEEGGDYEGAAPRVITVSTKPPSGTRKRIIGQVASERNLSESAVDNLWQAYRRLERELREGDNSAES